MFFSSRFCIGSHNEVINSIVKSWLMIWHHTGAYCVTICILPPHMCSSYWGAFIVAFTLNNQSLCKLRGTGGWQLPAQNPTQTSPTPLPSPSSPPTNGCYLWQEDREEEPPVRSDKEVHGSPLFWLPQCTDPSLCSCLLWSQVIHALCTIAEPPYVNILLVVPRVPNNR